MLRPTLSGLRSSAIAFASCLAVSTSGCANVALPETTGGPTGETLAPGEICPDVTPIQVGIRTEPNRVFLPTCAGGGGCVSRSVNVIVEPDHCDQTPVGITIANGDVAAFHYTDFDDVEQTLPKSYVGIHRPLVPITVTGKNPGSTTIEVSVPKGDGTEAKADLEVEVLDPALAHCELSDAKASGTLKGGVEIDGQGNLAGASISLPKGADKANYGSFLWSVSPFQATVACGDDMPIPDGYIALGPAITFGPEDKTFNREVPVSIPINPARIPAAARLRHLRVAYSGPAFKTPRTIPVADPRIEKVGDSWALTFKAPRLGTYRAVVKGAAGTNKRSRRLTHRAVIGVSMGGGGAAMFGVRHHNLFDVIAPLGGPVDWTWMLDYIEKNHLGGFRSIAPGTQLADIPLASVSCSTDAACKPDERCIGVVGTTPGRCVIMPAATEPYVHPQTFNEWWIEYPKNGTGGSFARAEYAQIFRDLALMFGNPNAENLIPGAENLPAGVRPDDKSVLGDHSGQECAVWVDRLPCPGGEDTCAEKTAQEDIANSCPTERCSHTLTLTGYVDDEYNPDGTFPVITVCDGGPQDPALSPYANTWTGSIEAPLEVALAVDYNGNGKRDELEPIIRAGHERWDDFGLDAIPSIDEPGYELAVDEDPSGDDYNAQYNPLGSEGDHRYDAGETFYDVGLDGVAGTKQQPAGGWQVPGDGYDVGEGDRVFTASHGLQRFWDFDPRSVLLGRTKLLPGGALDDDALARLDVWTDGGLRDLFNFHVDAQHFVGAFAARDRDAVYLTDFAEAPGLDPKEGNTAEPERIVFEDLQGVVLQRYGKIDPTADDLEKGSGQHVGTVAEIASRLQNALYFIGSRWPEPELRTLVADSAEKPAANAAECEVAGNCTFTFTSSDGRAGPVGVTLPPGYGHADQQDRRYPVIFMLHGYGQSPEDLEAAIVFLTNWMNGPTKSMASRLPKAILVYVDGRCRVGETGKAECVRGTFFTDSVRDDGAHIDQWWLELMDYIDQHYRTMGESFTESSD